MFVPHSVEYGRNRKRKLPFGKKEYDDEKRNEMVAAEKQPDTETKHDMFHIGKAMPDEPTERQPPAAEMGLVPKLSFRLLLSGPSASGKTNAARWMLDKYYHGAFDRIILMSPTAELDPVWSKLDGLKKKDRISKMSMRPIIKLLQKQEADVKKNGKGNAKKVLVIYDDTIGDNRIINSPEFLISFIRGRHFCVSCIVMTQSYTKVPRSVRLQATAVMVFPSFRSEIERLYDEHGPYQLSKREWYEMVQMAMQKSPDEQYPFFFIDSTKPVEDRYRRCLYDCIVIDPNRNPGQSKTKRRKKDEQSEEPSSEPEKRDARAAPL